MLVGPAAAKTRKSRCNQAELSPSVLTMLDMLMGSCQSTIPRTSAGVSEVGQIMAEVRTPLSPIMQNAYVAPRSSQARAESVVKVPFIFWIYLSIADYAATDHEVRRGAKRR